MRRLVLGLALIMTAWARADCPTELTSTYPDRHTSNPAWIAGVEYVLASFSVRNDHPVSVVFTSSGNPIADTETIQRWVAGPDTSTGPQYYDVPDANLTFRDSPANGTFASGATLSWEVAIDVSSVPAGFSNQITFRPEGANGTPPECTPQMEADEDILCYGPNQFAHTLLTSEFSCSAGEPFFAEITEAEAGLGEILLTVSAEQGSAAITSYDATCEDTDGNETDASSSGTSITVADLENGEDYTCTVTATNSIGTSAVSDSTDTLTPTSGGLPIWLLHEATTP